MSNIEKSELIYLDTVRTFMDKEIAKLQNLAIELEEIIMKEGQKFSLDSPYKSVYGGVDLTELHYSIERKILRSETAKQDAYFLQELKSHPYFARVDFQEDDYDTESFYIGLKSLFDEKEISPYVYDWRAPVAALFYEEFDDKAYFDAPSGRIEGEIQRKRQYKFEDGKLTYCFDSNIKIDDIILQHALSESSTDRLKVIVSSIQKEQNKAIRFGGDKNLVVSGPAGSGKTSVGFHRIAYLLYRHRNSLSSAEIVMFTGNDIFASYVSDIIPELGEAPIQDYSFYNLTGDTLDYYEQAEAIIEKEKDRAESIRIKYSDDFIKFTQTYIKNLTINFSDFVFLDDVVISGQALTNHLKKRARAVDFNDKLNSLFAYADEKIDTYFTENFEKIYEIANEKSSILDDTSKYIDFMKAKAKADAKKSIEEQANIDDNKILNQIYSEYDINLAENFSKDLLSGKIKFEDAMLALFIACLQGKISQRSDVRHVLIDEAQDYSPLQHRIIKFLYPKANFTILTDSNQAIVPLINSADTEKIAEIYDAQVLKLQKSYRSTKQISDFSKALLPCADYETFERNGDKPKIIISSNLADEIKKIIHKAEGSVCIITKTSPTAKKLYNDLIFDTDIELYDNKSKIFGDKIKIMPVVYTKGLEFDNVVIISENEEFFGDENKPYLYMASTRALHKLTIIKA